MPRKKNKCRKVQFPTPEAAEAATDKMRDRGRVAGYLLHPYFCKTCRAWHLTKNFYSGKGRRKRR